MATTGDELGGEGTGPEDDAVDVDGHDPSVLVVGEGGDVALLSRHTGIEIGEIQTAQASDGFDHGHPVLRAAHVGADGYDAQRLGHPTYRILGDVDGHHRVAVGHHPSGAGQPDPRRGAGDDGNLPLELSHDISSAGGNRSVGSLMVPVPPSHRDRSSRG